MRSKAGGLKAPGARAQEVVEDVAAVTDEEREWQEASHQ
jgi:hypothetical protein